MKPNRPKYSKMEQKKHYLALDGLRGVAAIVIVIFHFFEFIFPDFTKNPLGHGYLAVDFFFCLSGFVIAYAYDDRMATMSAFTFIKNRLIRLHPLVVLSAIMGVALYLLDPWATYAKNYSHQWVGIPFIQSLLMWPTTIEVPNRYGNLFPFNPPAWSLCMEYLANIFYLLVLWKMPRKYLPALLIMAMLALMYTAQKSGALLGGWSLSTFIEGVARVSFSFIAGMALKRYQFIIPNKLGYIPIAILLLATFMLPYFGINWVVELCIVLFIYPLITSLGAGTTVSEKLKPIALFMGKISYPLYMCHYWLISGFGNYFIKNNPSGWPLFWIVSGSTLGLILLAYLIMRFYDEPIRKWLSASGK